jgi:hypothetical protein
MKGEVSSGLRLCASCRRALTDDLSNVAALYAASEQALESSRYQSIKSMRRGHRQQAGISLDDKAVSVRDNVVSILSSWCGLVIEERPAAGPGGTEVPRLASYLRVHARWLAAHVAAVEFAGEIAGLVSEAAALVNPSRTRTIDLGPCATEGCGQTVRARIDSADAGAVPHVRCDAGHTWKPQQWLRLRHRFDQPGQLDQSGLAEAR